MAITTRPALITPGLKPVDPAFESWWVRPGGATRVRVRGGDRITIIDPDGGQPAEIVVLGPDPEVLGTRADAPASVLVDRELAGEDARAIRLFGTGRAARRARRSSPPAATRCSSSPRPAGAWSTATGRPPRSSSS